MQQFPVNSINYTLFIPDDFCIASEDALAVFSSELFDFSHLVWSFFFSPKNALCLAGLLIFNMVADPQNSGKSAKFPPPPEKREKREIHQKYYQIHVGKAHLILIVAIRPVSFTPNIQIYLETSSLQWVNDVLKLPDILRWTLQKTGH